MRYLPALWCDMRARGLCHSIGLLLSDRVTGQPQERVFKCGSTQCNRDNRALQVPDETREKFVAMWHAEAEDPVLVEGVDVEPLREFGGSRLVVVRL